MVAASASSCTHIPITSTLSPASFISAAHAGLDRRDRVELVLADVDDGQHRPVGEQEVRRQRLAVLGREAGAVERAALATARRRRPAARRARRRASCRAWPGAAPGCSRFSTVSRSASASSISTTRRCSIGSRGPVTSSSSNARSTNTIASTSRMLARNLLPRPSPLLAPSTRPPMSTTCTAAWTTLFDFRHRGQPVEALVGHLGDADVRVLGGERVRRGERAAAGEGVVQRALARVGEADQAEAFHAAVEATGRRGYGPRMRWGLSISLSAELADPAVLVDVARAAEAAGWDGVFVWDHLWNRTGAPFADPVGRAGGGRHGDRAGADRHDGRRAAAAAAAARRPGRHHARPAVRRADGARPRTRRRQLRRVLGVRGARRRTTGRVARHSMRASRLLLPMLSGTPVAAAGGRLTTAAGVQSAAPADLDRRTAPASGPAHDGSPATASRGSRSSTPMCGHPPTSCRRSPPVASRPVPSTSSSSVVATPTRSRWPQRARRGACPRSFPARPPRRPWRGRRRRPG